MRHQVSFAFAALVLSLPVAADVLVVDPNGGPGVDHTAIVDAVLAATDGDTLLVRDGQYTAFTIDGKSLTIIADGNAAEIEPPTIGVGFGVYVRNTSADQSVVVRGIRSGYGVSVQDCAGPVWLDGVACQGGVFGCSNGRIEGVRVVNSEEVTLTRCTMRGDAASIQWFFAQVAPGMTATNSNVVVYDSEIFGAWGLDEGWQGSPMNGAPGLRIQNSTVTLVGGAIRGGEGGLESMICGGAHATGGPGIEFLDSVSTVRRIDAVIAGGQADLDPLCPGEMGPAGPTLVGPGAITDVSGTARRLDANAPVRGGETLTFDVTGVPGDVPLVLVSTAQAPIALPTYGGALLLELPATDAFLLSPLGAGGTGTLSFPVPNIGPSVASLTFFAQALFLDSTPAVSLGGGAPIVLLDASF